MSIILSVIDAIRYSAQLRRCRVKSDDFQGSTFEHKGKVYDRTKYISERLAALRHTEAKDIKERFMSVQREIEKGRDVELNLAELEALNNKLAQYAANGIILIDFPSPVPVPQTTENQNNAAEGTAALPAAQAQGAKQRVNKVVLLRNIQVKEIMAEEIDAVYGNGAVIKE